MKLISRLFGTPPASPQPEPVAAEPAPVAPVTPPPPAVDPALQDELVRRIEAGGVETAELLRLAVDGETTRVRQAAATAVQDPALWPELLHRLRGRDKAAYKIIKQRHDAVLEAQRRIAHANAETEALCASIEKHATRAHDPLYEPTVVALSARWDALPEGADADLRERGLQALARCREVIAAHEAAQSQLAAEREAEAARAREAAAEREAARAAAAQAAAEQAAADAEARAAEEEARQAAAQQHEAQQTAANDALAEVTSLVRLSGAAMQRGDTRKAARHRQAIEDALPNVGTLPPHLARSLEQLDLKLNELRQWKEYVAAPKRIELIEEMEALIGVEEAPETLAEHIRALRQEWRTLNKGLAVDATAESERFEQAFQKAFQPCQVYFNEQAAIRRANLEARRDVLGRLQAFEAGLDAENPDYARIQRVLREAPQDWRGHAPVDRDATRPLDADFFRTLDRLRGLVAAWYARNLADKQALIARAQALASATDLARATDEAKRLQAQWKETGPVPHAQSQALWEEFRALCNGVFERRQQAHAQQSAAFEQLKTDAEALCAQVEAAAQEPPTDRAAGEARVRDWHAAFDALGELPRQHARALRDRFLRGVSRYEAQIAGIAQREAAAADDNARAAARHVRAWQRAVIEGADDASRSALRQAAETFIAGVPRWPSKGLLQALKQAHARADAADFAQGSDAAREQALRTLCIRAEILSGSTTPREDADARRDYEMQLLRQGLGQARQVDARDWEKMRLEWIALPAAAPALHDALEQRFMACVETALRRK